MQLAVIKQQLTFSTCAKKACSCVLVIVQQCLLFFFFFVCPSTFLISCLGENKILPHGRFKISLEHLQFHTGSPLILAMSATFALLLSAKNDGHAWNGVKFSSYFPQLCITVAGVKKTLPEGPNFTTVVCPR